MSSASTHWGTLINPDKSPAPLLEQLCLGIAQLMPSFDSNGTTDITPDRLATFYRKVGGNYDPLFLATKTQSLSFIYQSLGCFHSLQPSTNPYEPPCIPSLLPNGFVRWQTIQLLMDPDEHARFLQEAVKQWDIVDAQGQVLPKEIPRDAFPSEPDPEMMQWHEGVCRRLEYDFVKRNVHHASTPNFGAYHYHFSGKDPLPDEEDYFAQTPRRSNSRRQGHFDSDRSSRRRHHPRRLSAEYPASGSRRHDPEVVSRADGGRSGVSSPRGPSPSGFAERPRRSRGRDRPSGYGRPLSPREVDDAPDSIDISDNSLYPEDFDLRPKHKSRHHNLSPPPNSRARRHSHDAYERKPARDLSSSPNKRYESYDRRPPKPGKPTSNKRREGRSRSRPAGVKFRDFIFDSPSPAQAPDPPQYTAAPPLPPRGPPRPRYNIDAYLAEDSRRGSYSGGSTGGSRPGSGGSGSERPRSYSTAGSYPRTSRWTSPVRSSAAKRYIPTSVAEDTGFIPSPRRPT